MNEIKKRFDYLFERMSKADRSLNKPLFYEELDKAIEQAREEERRKIINELHTVAEDFEKEMWMAMTGIGLVYLFVEKVQTKLLLEQRQI